MSSSSNTTIMGPSIPYSRTIFFRILIVFLIPSLACSLLIFCYVFRLPQLRKQSSNHIIFVLLVILFLATLNNVPLRLYYLHENTAPIHTTGFCLFWSWCGYIFDTPGLFLMALASVERYLFVFHNPFLTRHHLFLSKLPTAISIIYPLVFYTFFVYGSWWCTNSFNYSTFACGRICFLSTSTFLQIFEIVNHHAVPVFIIFSANLILIIRVWKQKKRMNQANLWRKNVGMSAQLLSISLIYLIIWIPQCILLLILTFGPIQMKALVGPIMSEYAGNLSLFTSLLCPFMALAGFPLMREKIKQDLGRILRTQNQILTNTVMPTGENRAMKIINNRTR